MVRCEQFYEEFDKKGNFCGKSNSVVVKVKSYIEYMKRNKFGDFLISSNAIEPFIKIEFINSGKVHKVALKELRKKALKIGASSVTRRISIELINKANEMVEESFRIKSIPDVRTRMGAYEHDIGEISHETREEFNEFKALVGARNNDEVMKAMLQYCKNNVNSVIILREEIMESAKKSEKSQDEIEIVNEV